MTAPIATVVTRWRCPFCPRSLSSKSRMVEHIGKCWRNPAVRGCKTCKHFEPYNMLADEESCSAGVELSRNYCTTCGTTVSDRHGDCPEHPAAEIQLAGPVVNCDLWEAS